MRTKASGESALLLLDAIQVLRSDDFENRVDLMVGIRGFDPTGFSRTLEVALDGESLKFVGLEDFVAMKLFAGGPQDLADARSALEAAPEPPNKELLERLASRYGPETARSLQSLTSSFSRGLDSGLDLD